MKAFFILSVSYRLKYICLALLLLLVAVIDAFGVASIMPLIAGLSDADAIRSNYVLANIFEYYLIFGGSDESKFIVFLGTIVVSIILCSLSLKALAHFYQIRFVAAVEHYLSVRVLDAFLNENYVWFLSKNSADLTKRLLADVNSVVVHGIVPALTLFAQGAVVLALTALLLLVDFWLAIGVSTALSAAYFLVFFLVHRSLDGWGQRSFRSNQGKFSTLGELFGAIKEVKLKGLEDSYLARFASFSQSYAKANAATQIIGTLPRFALEGLAFSGLLGILVYMTAVAGNFSQAVPVVALYAFAGYRLMPALQQVYLSYTQLKFVGPALESLRDILEVPVVSIDEKTSFTLPITGCVEYKDVWFQYAGSDMPALKDINLTIPLNQSVGIVGATGSGKTTVVDLLIGLLHPHSGSVSVGGCELSNSTRRQWQNLIGYVPQQVYLSDASIACNIAFGVDIDDIDHDAVRRCAEISMLHDFVMSELPQGYETRVGERGARLSGGQCQRIGIARALYKKPRLLVLDEATSALDSVTERAVIERIGNLSSEITIVTIAHRLSTVKNCDQIYMLDRGQIVARGTFDELMQVNDHFREMANNV